MKNMKKWIAAHKKSVIITSSSVGVLVLIAVILGCMLLTTQQSFPRPEITPEDWMRQSRVVMKSMQQVMQSEPGQTLEMVLTPEDAAALLKFAVNNDQVSAMFSGKNIQAGVPWSVTYSKDGLVHASLIANTGIGSLNCIVRVSAMVSYANNAFRITPVECKVGSITIPNSIITERVLPGVLAELDNNNYVQMFHSAVESISRDDKNRLVIRYIPDNAKAFAMTLF